MDPLLEVKTMVVLTKWSKTLYLLINKLKMLWLQQLMEDKLQLNKKAVDQYLLIGMTGMIQNTLKNKDKLLSSSKRNRKILRLPMDQRKRRRSLRKRRRLEPPVVMHLMLISMMVKPSINTLASILSKNLTWMKNSTAIDMKKKKRSIKEWVKLELNKIEANLMLQASTTMINPTIMKIRSEVTSTTSKT